MCKTQIFKLCCAQQNKDCHLHHFLLMIQNRESNADLISDGEFIAMFLYDGRDLRFVLIKSAIVKFVATCKIIREENA